MVKPSCRWPAVGTQLNGETYKNRVRPLAGTTHTTFELDPALLDRLAEMTFTFSYYDGTDKALRWNLA